jgi:hypothetical protein
MSWTLWELPELSDSADRRTILRGRGDVRVCAVDEHKAWQEQRLSGRWTVTSVSVRAVDAPSPGDIVVFWAQSREDVDDSGVWGGPTRVLARRDATEGGFVELTLLEDRLLNEYGTGKRDAEVWLSDHSDAFGRSLSEDESWSLLSSGWRLMPLCARCGAQAKIIVYGEPIAGSVGSDPDVLEAGCVIPCPAPSYHCRACHHEWSFPPDLRDLPAAASANEVAGKPLTPFNGPPRDADSETESSVTPPRPYEHWVIDATDDNQAHRLDSYEPSQAMCGHQWSLKILWEDDHPPDNFRECLQCITAVRRARTTEIPPSPRPPRQRRRSKTPRPSPRVRVVSGGLPGNGKRS